MPPIISLLRGVNVGGHHKIKMDTLRALYTSLKLRNPQTYVQSGNVVFQSPENDLPLLAKRIETAIEKKFGFRPAVILRTAEELRQTIARNPFAKRAGVEPGKLLVTFLADKPSREAASALLQLKTNPEELHLMDREIFIYFPNGAGKSKLNWSTLDKLLKTTGTARNWNTVTKLLQMAEALESSS